ncbi:MAG: hypothetical protein KY453_08485, partial [Gemmatimonadetes bacterium]|nr:hypothetical protein [Gemmatimonadota bacterium]
PGPPRPRSGALDRRILQAPTHRVPGQEGGDPREEGAVRQTLLPGSAYDEATRELDELDDSGLADLFRRSEPKTIG